MKFCNFFGLIFEVFLSFCGFSSSLFHLKQLVCGWLCLLQSTAAMMKVDQKACSWYKRPQTIRNETSWNEKKVFFQDSIYRNIETKQETRHDNYQNENERALGSSLGSTACSATAMSMLFVIVTQNSPVPLLLRVALKVYFLHFALACRHLNAGEMQLPLANRRRSSISIVRIIHLQGIITTSG